jgi:phosphatidylglycerophosphatase A
MLKSPARVVAFGFGSGLLRPAPGTWGTAFGWLLWELLLAPCPLAAQGAAIFAGLAIGTWACQQSGDDLRVPDHGGMVWDEVVAFWLVLMVLPGDLVSQAAGFAVFRAFDIVKPAPIRQCDAALKNGFGVMLDDLIAAGYTLFVFALWKRLIA